MKMHNFGKVKLHTEYGALGSKEDFLDRAIDALSVLKISNSYLESTLAKEDANHKTLTTFTMIKKSILKIEAFLDSAKHEEKHLSKKNNGVINIFAREGTDFIVIDLKDSGPGFPPENLKKVFSSLFTTKSGGNGLGLKVAKTIIETHGGTISVRNNPTTFSIKLPKN